MTNKTFWIAAQKHAAMTGGHGGPPLHIGYVSVITYPL